MKLLYMTPGWALRCIRDYRQHRETLLRQRLIELQQQSGPITSSLNSDYWLVVFFRKELVQQYRSLKQVNRELKRRNHLSV